VQLESHADNLSREDVKSMDSDLRPESGCSKQDCLSPEPDPEEQYESSPDKSVGENS